VPSDQRKPANGPSAAYAASNAVLFLTPAVGRVGCFFPDSLDRALYLPGKRALGQVALAW